MPGFEPGTGFTFGVQVDPGSSPCIPSSSPMHIALEDLKLDHLWVVYPGTRNYPLTEQITALPLQDLPTLELKAPA